MCTACMVVPEEARRSALDPLELTGHCKSPCGKRTQQKVLLTAEPPLHTRSGRVFIYLFFKQGIKPSYPRNDFRVETNLGGLFELREVLAD